MQHSVELDWSNDDSKLAVCGVEHTGSFPVTKLDGTTTSVSFRADRVDVEDGKEILTDYKTGRPLITVVREDSRRKQIQKEISRGKMLQGIGYAMCKDNATGRYRYLRDGLDPRTREVVVSGADEELVTSFRETTTTLFAALDAGVLFPRLENPKGESVCDFCDVAEACSKNDTASRERLRFTAQRVRPRQSLQEDGTTENIYGHLFYLGEPLPEEEPHE